MCCVNDLQCWANICSSFSQRTKRESPVCLCASGFVIKNELRTPIPLFMCFSMESSPPTQSAPLSSVLPTSGLPESMTVGECLTFLYLSASYCLSLSVSSSLFSDWFCGFCHVIITISWAQLSNIFAKEQSWPRAIMKTHCINQGLNMLTYQGGSQFTWMI